MVKEVLLENWMVDRFALPELKADLRKQELTRKRVRGIENGGEKRRNYKETARKSGAVFL